MTSLQCKNVVSDHTGNYGTNLLPLEIIMLIDCTINDLVQPRAGTRVSAVFASNSMSPGSVIRVAVGGGARRNSSGSRYCCHSSAACRGEYSATQNSTRAYWNITLLGKLHTLHTLKLVANNSSVIINTVV